MAETQGGAGGGEGAAAAGEAGEGASRRMSRRGSALVGRRRASAATMAAVEEAAAAGGHVSNAAARRRSSVASLARAVLAASDDLVLELQQDASRSEMMQDGQRQPKHGTEGGTVGLELVPGSAGVALIRGSRLSKGTEDMLESLQNKIYSTPQSHYVLLVGEHASRKTTMAEMSAIRMLDGWRQSQSVKQTFQHARALVCELGEARQGGMLNCSRQSTLYRMRFDSTSGAIAGIGLDMIGLELSRITFRRLRQMNFHAFYDVVLFEDNPAMRRTLHLTEIDDPMDFRLNATSVECLWAFPEHRARYDRFVAALAALGLDRGSDEFQQLLALLVGILHLGDVEIAEDDAGNAALDEESEASVAHAAPLLGLAPESLREYLLFRVFSAGSRDSIHRSHIPAEQAATYCDLLCKMLYNAVVQWVMKEVDRMWWQRPLPQDNSGDTPARSAGPPSGAVDAQHTFNIVDTPGYETVEWNGVDQLCRNYANEVMYSVFRKMAFGAEVAVWEEEGLPLAVLGGARPASMLDNTDSLELLESGDNEGIVMLLEVQTQLGPTASDEAFLSQTRNNCMGHRSYSKPAVGESDGFVIAHYFGPVQYNTAGFVDQNLETVHRSFCDFSNLLAESEHVIIKWQEAYNEEQSPLVRGSGRGKRGSPSSASSSSSAASRRPGQLKKRAPHSGPSGRATSRRESTVYKTAREPVTSVRLMSMGIPEVNMSTRFLEEFRRLRNELESAVSGAGSDAGAAAAVAALGATANPLHALRELRAPSVFFMLCLSPQQTEDMEEGDDDLRESSFGPDSFSGNRARLVEDGKVADDEPVDWDHVRGQLARAGAAHLAGAIPRQFRLRVPLADIVKHALQPPTGPLRERFVLLNTADADTGGAPVSPPPLFEAALLLRWHQVWCLWVEQFERRHKHDNNSCSGSTSAADALQTKDSRREMLARLHLPDSFTQLQQQAHQSGPRKAGAVATSLGSSLVTEMLEEVDEEAEDEDTDTDTDSDSGGESSSASHAEHNGGNNADGKGPQQRRKKSRVNEQLELLQTILRWMLRSAAAYALARSPARSGQQENSGASASDASVIQDLAEGRLAETMLSGRTRLFCTQLVADLFGMIATEVVLHAVRLLQAFGRQITCRVHFSRTCAHIVLIQKRARGMVYRRRVTEWKASLATLLSKCMRRFVARARYTRMRGASIVIQRHARGYMVARKFKVHRDTAVAALVLIQAQVRGHSARGRYRRAKAGITRLQAVCRKMMARSRFSDIASFRARIEHLTDAQTLQPNEHIIIAGFVLKKGEQFLSGLKRRLLILTSGPRLLYIDPDASVLKGEVPWDPQLKVHIESATSFLVETQRRTYQFYSVLFPTPSEWRKALVTSRDKPRRTSELLKISLQQHSHAHQTEVTVQSPLFAMQAAHAAGGGSETAAGIRPATTTGVSGAAFPMKSSSSSSSTPTYTSQYSANSDDGGADHRPSIVPSRLEWGPQDRGNRVTMQGILHKKSDALIAAWRKRFCVLEGTCLRFFKSATHKDLLDEINLHPDDEAGHRTKFLVQPVNGRPTAFLLERVPEAGGEPIESHQLQAPTDEDLRRWLRAVCEACPSAEQADF